MPKLRSTYDRRLIYETSYEGRTAFHGYDSLAKCECKIVEDNVRKLAYNTRKRNFSTFSLTIVSPSYDKLKIILR